MDPTPGRWGPFWTPITPEAGSLLQAVQHLSALTEKDMRRMNRYLAALRELRDAEA